MNLKCAIPPKVWPALMILGLFLVSWIVESVGTDGGRCGRELRAVGVWLAVVVVPLTVLLVWADFLRSCRSGGYFGKLTLRSVGIRLVVSWILAIIGLILFSPRICTIYKFEAAANEVRAAAKAISFRRLGAMPSALIPAGESSLAILPENIRGNHETDPWGNPLMLVSEERGGGLWLGVYSMGRDGVSSSKGNDPDDLNSWGQDGHGFDGPEIHRGELLRVGGEILGLSVCFLPLCFGVFVPQKLD